MKYCQKGSTKYRVSIQAYIRYNVLCEDIAWQFNQTTEEEAHVQAAAESWSTQDKEIIHYVIGKPEIV